MLQLRSETYVWWWSWLLCCWGRYMKPNPRLWRRSTDRANFCGLGGFIKLWQTWIVDFASMSLGSVLGWCVRFWWRKLTCRGSPFIPGRQIYKRIFIMIIGGPAWTRIWLGTWSGTWLVGKLRSNIVFLTARCIRWRFPYGNVKMSPRILSQSFLGLQVEWMQYGSLGSFDQEHAYQSGSIEYFCREICRGLY